VMITNTTNGILLIRATRVSISIIHNPTRTSYSNNTDIILLKFSGK
jgi:hypothetical protein